MVVFDTRPRSGARSFADSMRVIEAKKATAVLGVQRQRVAKAVRPLWRDPNPPYSKLDPMFSCCISDECFSIEQ